MPEAPLSLAAEAVSRDLPKGLPREEHQRKHVWLGMLLLVALIVVGGLLWFHSENSTSASAESTLALETFVVNLPGSGQRAYLRIGITLGLAHPLPPRDRAEGLPMALVRDTILGVLATAQPDALLQLEGKSRLKNDLLKALQERVPQIGVQNIYFTELLVQM